MNEQVNVSGIQVSVLSHEYVGFSRLCFFFCFKGTWLCSPQNVWGKNPCNRNGKSLPSPRTNSKPKTRCSFRLWSGKPFPSGCAKCSNNNLCEPTPAPAVASPPFQLLNYLISGGSANLHAPFCHSSPYVWTCTGIHSESPAFWYVASCCESNPNSSLYSESREMQSKDILRPPCKVKHGLRCCGWVRVFVPAFGISWII